MLDFLKSLPKEISERIRCHELMSKHTSFQIGGPCDYFFEPETIEEISTVYRQALDFHLPITIIGNGSNLLVADKGIRGLVIALKDNYAKTQVFDLKTLPINHPQSRKLKAISEVYPHSPLYTDFGASPTYLMAEAGAKLGDISAMAKEYGLTGLEFACGIPGSIGGAIYMNAGAYGNSIADTAVLVRSLTQQGQLKWSMGDENGFDYRSSNFALTNQIVLEAYFCLRPGNFDQISDLVADYTRRRTESQPLELPSAGSMFKRPHGYFAGKLISDTNLKGLQIGGAAVSQKHANFVVNLGGATARDVIRLVQSVQMQVLEKFGVKLEPEVRFVGEF